MSAHEEPLEAARPGGFARLPGGRQLQREGVQAKGVARNGIGVQAERRVEAGAGLSSETRGLDVPAGGIAGKPCTVTRPERSDSSG